MSLDNMLEAIDSGSVTRAANEITRERIQSDLPRLQQLISYWRWYPDKFIDYLCSLNPDNTFHFFFYQRV